MRPILRGLLRFEALDDPARDLADFVFANEALDVQDENQLRVRAAMERK